MRILLINPNTTESVTETVAQVLRAKASASVEIRAATGRFGARYIASRAAVAIASHAALDAFAERGADCDAVYLACFGDPGLFALQEISPVPVIGMAEASCRAAARQGRFAIVTGGDLWRPMLAEFMLVLGLAESCAAIRTIEPTGGEIARDPDAALASLAAACEDCVREEGAEIVVLGGAALAGLAQRIQPRVSVPVLCSAEIGAEAVLQAAAHGRSDDGEIIAEGPEPVESVGLGVALAEALRRGSRRR